MPGMFDRPMAAGRRVRDVESGGFSIGPNRPVPTRGSLTLRWEDPATRTITIRRERLPEPVPNSMIDDGTEQIINYEIRWSCDNQGADALIDATRSLHLVLTCNMFELLATYQGHPLSNWWYRIDASSAMGSAKTALPVYSQRLELAAMSSSTAIEIPPFATRATVQGNPQPPNADTISFHNSMGATIMASTRIVPLGQPYDWIPIIGNETHVRVNTVAGGWFKVIFEIGL